MLIAAQFVSLLLSTLLSDQFPLSFAGTVWRRFGLMEQTAVLVIAAAIACLAASRPEDSEAAGKARLSEALGWKK